MTTRLPVLVVDDDELILEMVRTTLQDEGYPVLTAEDGSAALHLLRTANPALILLDLRMPGMNGWEFASAYRALPDPHVPIVVMSAGREPESQVLEIGAVAALAKPFDLDEMLALVSQYAGKGMTLGNR